MTAHIVNKKLDPEGYPGTLSDDILKNILRERLRFDGVVFSDDMQMHAITKHYGLEDAIRLAILAGVDIMTFSNNISGSDERTVDKVHSIIRDMVRKGVISESRIDESFDRILRLKKQLLTQDRVALLKQELERTASDTSQQSASLQEFENKLVVNSAHITNYGERAVDTFYVTDLFGEKIARPQRMAALKERLMKAAAMPGEDKEAA